MYNKASLYQEVQHLRKYMGISLSDTTLDIIEYCKREYSDIKTEAIPLKTSGLHGMMVPPESNSEPYIILLNSSRSEIEQRFDYTHELMEEFSASVNEFLAFRRYDILPDKGKVSKQMAVSKAEAEYAEFNKTQKIISDFDREVKRLAKKETE